MPSLFESYWYGDEAIYAAVSQAIANGKLLYAQTWDHKPPFIFLFFYPATLLGWQLGFPLLRLVNILLGVGSLIFLSEILKKEVSNKLRFSILVLFSFLLGSPILEGNVVNAEVIFMLFNLASLYFFIHKKRFLLAGVMGYLSVITKVPGFVEFAVMAAGFAVVWMRSKGFKFTLIQGLKISIGFVVPIVLTLLYFVFRGTMSDFIYANFAFNRIYSLHQGNFVELLGREIPATYPSALSLFGVFLLSTFGYWRKKISEFTYIAVVLLAGEFFASLLSGKNYSHYFLQVLPAAALVVAIFGKHAFGNPKIKIEKVIFGGITALLFTPMILVFQNGGRLPVYAEPQEYYTWFLTDRDKFWWGKAEAEKDLSSYIDSNYTEHNPVYIYTNKPWILALTTRELTNKYVTWFHLEYRKEHLDEELLNMNKAALFVLDRNPKLLESVEDLLENNFEKIDSYKNFDIYLRK